MGGERGGRERERERERERRKRGREGEVERRREGRRESPLTQLGSNAVHRPPLCLAYIQVFRVDTQWSHLLAALHCPTEHSSTQKYRQPGVDNP